MKPFLSLAVVLVSACLANAQTPILAGKLQDGDRIALCGDSITEAKNYTCLVQGYLYAAKPAANLTVANFGWGGETTWGFKKRLANDVLWFKPTVATVCYGMNDGGYAPLSEQRAKDYDESTRDIVRQLKAAGVRLIVLCGPGCVDSDTFQGGGGFRGGPTMPAMYNKTLSQLNEAARKIAQEEGVAFADMFNTMNEAMKRFKAKYPGVPIGGNDGIHPDNNGHVVMAYAVLKALGCTGDVGAITVDLASKSATATEGQTVDSFDGESLKVTSAKYPLPISKGGDARNLGGGMEAVPFAEELNRYVLVVKGGAASAYDVSWAGETQRFTADELAKGVNLMDRFTKYPFAEAFRRLDQAVHAQQDFEIPTMKQFIHQSEENLREEKESPEARKSIVENSLKLGEALRARTGRAVKPVQYTLTIKPAL